MLDYDLPSSSHFNGPFCPYNKHQRQMCVLSVNFDILASYQYSVQMKWEKTFFYHNWLLSEGQTIISTVFLLMYSRVTSTFNERIILKGEVLGLICVTGD